MLKETLEKGIAHLPDLRNKDGSRVDGAPESQPHAARCSVATGSLPVPSAGWLEAAAEEFSDLTWGAKESGLYSLTTEKALEILLRHAGLTNKRQPEENTQICRGSAANTNYDE